MKARLHTELVETLLSVRDDLLRDGREDTAEAIRVLIMDLIHELEDGLSGPTSRPRLMEIVAVVISLLGLVR